MIVSPSAPLDDAEQADAVVAGDERDHVVDVGCVAERGEDLLAADQETAVDRLRDGGDARGGAPAQAFGEGLAVQQVTRDHAVEQELAACSSSSSSSPLRPSSSAIGPASRHVAVCMLNVSAVAPQWRPSSSATERVGDEVGTEPAVPLGHAQAVEAGVAQIGEVLVRERRIAVVLRGAVP